MDDALAMDVCESSEELPHHLHAGPLSLAVFHPVPCDHKEPLATQGFKKVVHYLPAVFRVHAAGALIQDLAQRPGAELHLYVQHLLRRCLAAPCLLCVRSCQHTIAVSQPCDHLLLTMPLAYVQVATCH